ncbi:MAG: membrane protein of unknown function [Promethearchaeota archaeon]|nr:MAG: membrane protein of unknown function [Candidatus Lokiarchaeota archaeon]
MKKRYIAFILLSLFGILVLEGFQNANATFSYEIDVNKDSFYEDETIILNGSWYIPETAVDNQVSVRIYNSTTFETGNLVWMSELFTQKGYISVLLTIPISSLNLNLSAGAADFYITSYIFYLEEPFNINNFFPNTPGISIQIHKKVSSKSDDHNPPIYLNIIIPSTIGSIAIIIGLAVFFMKRDKSKKLEDLFIEF